MKHRFFTLTISLLLIANVFVNAQQNTCVYDTEPYIQETDEVRAANCSATTPLYNNYYNRYNFYLDNYDNLPNIKIPINLIVWQDDFGNGNWVNTPSQIADLEQQIGWVNALYANNCTPSDPISGVTDRSGTKIQFEIKGIYFFQSSTVWGSVGPNDINVANSMLPVVAPGLQLENDFNIHITGGSYSGLPSVLGHAVFPNYGSTKPYVVTYWNEATLSYFWSEHLAHELGHTLNLQHTYNGNICNQADPDYLDDVFGIGSSAICPHQSGGSCDPWLSSNTCTNNILGGAIGMCYFSPKQIARIHRSLLLMSIRDYVKCEEYFVDPIEITSDETWDFDIKLYNPILIKPGVTLTIKCKVAFAMNHQIVVEPGGKLVLDGGILTSHCDFWQGVELRGNSNLSQNPGNQGQVELKNDAVIENAVCGIKTIAIENNIPDYTKTGGVIRAVSTTGTNCTFKNCRTGIEMLDYHFYNPFTGIEVKNISRIYNCRFITDDNFPSTTQYPHPSEAIYLSDINGVGITGCVFENQRSDLTTVPINERGSGVITLDAAFNLSPRYVFSTGQKVSGTENQFKNLFRSVSIGTGVQGTSSNVKDNIFENNGYGVVLDVGIYNLIARNSFLLPGADLSHPSYNYSFGIYSEFGTNFNIEENSFTNITSNLLPNQAMHSNHSFGPVAKFYRNTVNGTSFGVQTAGSSNLEFKVDCNSFSKTSNSTIDFHHSQGNLASQGSQSVPAKNVFTGSCNNSNLAQVYKNPGALSFVYTYQNPNGIVSCHNLGGFLNSSTLNNFCLNTIPNFSIISFPQKTASLKSSIIGYNEIIADKKLLIDGNNTQGLLNLIANETDPEIVKDALLAVSPYLSDEVLIAYILSSAPAGHLKQVLLVNSPLTEKVNAVLSTKNLPAGIRKQIANEQTGVSERKKLEIEIEGYTLDKNLDLNDLVRIYLDTNWIDSAVYVLKQEGSLEAICALVPIQIKRDTIDSRVQMDRILFEASCLEQIDPNCTRAAELRTFCDLHSAMMRILQRPGKYFSMTSSERQFLETVATGETRPAAHARAILNFIDRDYQVYEGEYAYFLQSMFDDEKITLSDTKEYTFDVNPNPSTGLINIKIDKSEISDAVVVLTDISGKIIRIINMDSDNISVDLNGIAEGNYLIYLVKENKILDIRKIIYAK